MKPISPNAACPCCSGKNYEECCGPCHLGKSAETALQLMRSRYSAYALDLPDYIIATTHPRNPAYEKDLETWRKSIVSFSGATHFKKLEIGAFEEKGNTATVTFTAYLEQAGQDVSFQEKSLFERIDSKWLYLDRL